MLAYLFWHRPQPGVERGEYEEAQQQFHALLEVESACFWAEQLPFKDGAGYEDWYLVEDWPGLGDLNAAAVDARRKGGHDRAAGMLAEGWGGIYASAQGPVAIPSGARWTYKDRGQSTADFLAGIDRSVPVWQRQLVLGPAPEFCIGDGPARRSVVPLSSIS